MFKWINRKVIKIVLGALGLTALVVLLSHYSTEDITTTAREQLSAIKLGNFNKAYSMTSQSFQKDASMEDFKKYVDKFPVFRNYTDISFNDQQIKNGQGFLYGVIKGADLSQMKIEYKLIKEDSGWKIQGIQLEDEKNKKSDLIGYDNSGATIYDALISDAMQQEGYVSENKTSLPASAGTIFISVRIDAPRPTGTVKAVLFLPNGLEFAHSESKIADSGNIIQTFAFAKNKDSWPLGKYTIQVSLSSGDQKGFDFEVK